MTDRSAVSIAEGVRTGRLSAVDMVSEALERALASHDSLNAFTLIDKSGALARAEGIDRLVAEGKDPGPLAGVPIGLKDLVDQAGLPNTRGSGFPPDVPAHSASVVRSIGAAGGVIIGRTGLHEWAFGFTSENAFFGPVRNPWDPSTSPGGSSGGSGAAVAARITPLAIGTDTGGSVRVPAALCGVFGLKPTHGAVSIAGVDPLAPSLDTVGPIATNVRDLAIMFKAITSYDPADPWSAPAPLNTQSPSDGSIGLVKQWVDGGAISRRVLAGLNTFRQKCEEAGFRVVDIDEPILSAPDAVFRAAGAEIMQVHRGRFEASPELYSEETRTRLAQSQDSTVDDLLDAQRWASAATSRLRYLAGEGVSAFVGPTVGALVKRIGQPDMDIDGSAVFHREALARFTAPINRLGLPALAAPINASGAPPVSIQFVGPRWSESTLFDVAAALEDAGVLTSPIPPAYEIPN